jgi:hypothetical protein
MKNIILSFFGLLSFTISQSQNVGIGTPTPHASAQLEISSANKGLLIPRMTQANRPVSPATGLLIYQTNNTPGFYYFNGSSWAALSGPWAYNGSTIYNTNEGNVGIGTNSPAGTLHVNAGADGSLLITNEFTGYTLSDGLRIRMNGLTSTIQNSENGDLQIQTNQGAAGLYGTPSIWIKPTGAIGIGTSTPGAKLEVAGQVKITGGSPGNGKVLTSDATGLASWGSGTYYTAFQATATAGNTTSNNTALAYSGAASTDIVMVTPIWESVYLNAPIGVYWFLTEWRVFRQDQVNMPIGAKFNVVVIKP